MSKNSNKRLGFSRGAKQTSYGGGRFVSCNKKGIKLVEKPNSVADNKRTVKKGRPGNRG